MPPVLAAIMHTRKTKYYELMNSNNIFFLKTFPDEATACQAILHEMQSRYNICTHVHLSAYFGGNDDRRLYNRKQMTNMLGQLKTRKALHRFFKKYTPIDGIYDTYSLNYGDSWTFRIQAITPTVVPRSHRKMNINA